MEACSRLRDALQKRCATVHNFEIEVTAVQRRGEETQIPFRKVPTWMAEVAVDAMLKYKTEFSETRYHHTKLWSLKN